MDGGNVDGTTPIYSITCHGTTLCLAGDSNGNVLSSTSPAADPRLERAVDFGAPRIFALACPAADFCIAADNAGAVYASADPTGDRARGPLRPTGDSFGARGATCASTALCIVSDYQSNIAVGALSPPAVTTGAATR